MLIPDGADQPINKIVINIGIPALDQYNTLLPSGSLLSFAWFVSLKFPRNIYCKVLPGYDNTSTILCG
jgi:hypothetical protein